MINFARKKRKKADILLLGRKRPETPLTPQKQNKRPAEILQINPLIYVGSLDFMAYQPL